MRNVSMIDDKRNSRTAFLINICCCFIYFVMLRHDYFLHTFSHEIADVAYQLCSFTFARSLYDFSSVFGMRSYTGVRLG